MQRPAAQSAKPVEIEIPGRFHPVVVMLTVLPVVLIVALAAHLAIDPTPPIPLLILFAWLVGSCIPLLVESLRILLGGTMKCTPEAFVVSRFLKEDVYPWMTLEAIKLTPATGTFGDNPLVDLNERVGMGLFIKGSEREREHELDADIILSAGEKATLQPLMRAQEKIQMALKRAQAPKRPTAARPRTRQSNQRKEFRQRPAAATPQNLVSQFRNS